MTHNYMTSELSEYSVLKEKARCMRKAPTEAESVLWKYISNEQLGYKFRRQHIIDSYIVDFVCLQKKVVIEVDGKYHNTAQQRELDEQRQLKISSLGFTVIRFTNEQVMCDIDNTLLTIKNQLLNI